MRWVKQETPNSCGAAAIAMVAGVTWAQAVKALGTISRTVYPDLKRGLRNLGVRHGDMIRLKPGDIIPAPSILKLRWSDKTSHWVVWDGRYCWDPTTGRLLPEDYGSEWHPTSCLPVELAGN